MAFSLGVLAAFGVIMHINLRMDHGALFCNLIQPSLTVLNRLRLERQLERSRCLFLRSEFIYYNYLVSETRPYTLFVMTNLQNYSCRYPEEMIRDGLEQLANEHATLINQNTWRISDYQLSKALPIIISIHSVF
ncbi:hypothetical protein BJ878DRAFT_519526 [Calycina marina]|uniref:Uncharacterized protein n=1 Tax=Calycina marina TaxID=1763456 RepID=A0A9P7YXP6_9HELO|nr:hypothetical protein BJ878DRAFT_519526 [Calycina marina]